MKRQRGAALMVILLIAGALAAFFAVRALNGANTERDKVTAAALAQAKDALIGFAVTYRDSHPNQVFGYLPCPDDNNAAATPGEEDTAIADCKGKDISTVRRLPWNTLGVAPLRDSSGECLWYAVSGHAKGMGDPNKTDSYNWDTLGQFVVQDVNGSLLHGASPHDRPLGVVFAPRESINGLSRAGAATECRGSATIAAYLDGGATDSFYLGTTPAANATTTLVLSTKASSDAGVNNDQGLWISSREIFDRVKRRGDFKTDIDDMLGDLEQCLAAMGSISSASATNKGIDAALAACPVPGADIVKVNVRRNWRDNLLYSKPGTLTTGKTCKAVLIFSGERAAGQMRDTVANQGNPVNYLEGINSASFQVGLPPAGPFLMPEGSGGFDINNPSRDVMRCVNLPGPTVSFAKDLAAFVITGVGVTTNLVTKTVTIADAAGASGGCLWSPVMVPLAGKVVRAFYDFQFAFPDMFAVGGGGSDRGNGFTFQLVTGQFGAPPNTCGTEAAMGSLGAADVWGGDSIIVETDVHRDAGVISDPSENHTAIMLNGNIGHTGPGDTISMACDGTATGCRHSPANKFEESVTTAPHNQRVEIHTGCTPGCGSCDPTSHTPPNTYARITTWIDCVNCADVVTDLDRAVKVPNLQRCVDLGVAMYPSGELNTVYFGLTGGFRSGASQQGITLKNLVVRSE